MVYFGIDLRSIDNDKMKTDYIDKLSSPCLLVSNSSEDASIFIFRV